MCRNTKTTSLTTLRPSSYTKWSNGEKATNDSEGVEKRVKDDGDVVEMKERVWWRWVREWSEELDEVDKFGEGEWQPKWGRRREVWVYKE